jgi:hypothetical protein
MQQTFRLDRNICTNLCRPSRPRVPTAALVDTGLDKVLVSVWLLTVVKKGKELEFESVEEAEVEC